MYNSTGGVLRAIQYICKGKVCRECPLDKVFCNCTPESWTKKEIEDLEDIIDNYGLEEEENVDQTQ